MNEAIYEKLKEVARAKRTIYFGEIVSLSNLGITNPHDPRLGKILEEICRYELQNSRPMLSAVVINRKYGRPGCGFFKLASGLGRFQGTDEDKFWATELSRVYDYWSSH